MQDSVHSQPNSAGYTNSWHSTVSLRIEPYCQMPFVVGPVVLQKENCTCNTVEYGVVHQRMHGESSLQLITLTDRMVISSNADLNIISNKIVQ